METVQFQIFVFSLTLYGGILIGILYDIYKVMVGNRRKKTLISSILDIIFLCFVFFIMIFIIFPSNYGDLRAYVFLGFIVGFFLYQKIIGKVVTALFAHIFIFLKQFIKTIKRYVTLPLRRVMKIFFKPASFIKNSFRVLIVNFKRKRRIFKNTLKDWLKYYKLIIKRDRQ